MNQPDEALKSSTDISTPPIGDSAPDEPQPKRRRRVLSCQLCQRSKTRCELITDLLGCRRCQNLRLSCSLRQQSALNSVAAEPRSESIEQRLQSQEERLNKLVDFVQNLSRNEIPHGSGPPQSSTVRASARRSSSECFQDLQQLERRPDPVVLSLTSSPIGALRAIGQRYTVGRRKALDDLGLDLVSGGILSKDEEAMLATLFYTTHKYSRLFYDRPEKELGRIFSESSLFHRAVCCLRGIVCHAEYRDTLIHRKIYDRLRSSIGQALLSSPLTIDQIYGVLLMTDGMLDPASQESEYIDSWLLTGFCAQQAIVAIDFPRIVLNIVHEDTSADDQKQMRLWAVICLQHLHWASSTGRPSVIEDTYVGQCENLANFYDATVQDSMLLAEIQLYSTLTQLLRQNVFNHSTIEPAELSTWAKKWDHVLTLSTASTLKLGYFSACLVLVMRQLEAIGENLQSQTFMVDSVVPDPGSSRSKSAPEAESGRDADANLTTALVRRCSKLAETILDTFWELKPPAKKALCTETHLCISYCTLILAHYHESQSGLSGERCLELVQRVDNWYCSMPQFSKLMKFGQLAQQRLRNRLKKDGTDKGKASATLPWPDSLATGSVANGQGNGDEEPTHQEFMPEIDIPSMQDFFGGAFLDQFDFSTDNGPF